MICNQCGAESTDRNQRFCEACGAEIPKIEDRPENTAIEVKEREIINPLTSNQSVPYSVKGGLFDINRNYYVFKEKHWDWGGGDIMDEHGNIIGKMKRKILSVRRRVSLLEVDGTLAATIHAKLLSARGAQDLFDPEGNLIARIKKKILSFFRPKFFLEDANGTRWYEAQGKLMGWSFKVMDLSTGKIVAEIEKADRWRDVFLGGLFDFKDTYALKILDNETDRRILAGFVLSIDNILHDM